MRLELSAPLRGVVCDQMINTLFELLEKPRKEVMKFRNMGKRKMSQWEAFAQDNGLRFGMEYSKDEKAMFRSIVSQKYEQ